MFFGYFFFAFILAFSLTPLVFFLMRRLKVVDKPMKEGRKIHTRPVPLGGGLAIYISFFVLLGVAYWGQDLIGRDIAPKHLLGLFLGATILMIGGFLDDKYRLSPTRQIWFPILAVLIVLSFGIGPHVITNPLGGVIDLSGFKISVDGFGNLIILADALVFVWLMGMMFTTKFLDGLDGLVTGVVSIGALVIFFLSRDQRWWQPDVALLSLVLSGACLGFLIWNWHPAKIFLGEGGSLVTGFLLGALAIISGGKMATTLLVMGLPALDVLRVIARRMRKGRSVFAGDSEHLHYRLLEAGFSQRQAVLLMYSIALLFGLSALFLQSTHKLIAFIFIFIVLVMVAGKLVKNNKS